MIKKASFKLPLDQYYKDTNIKIIHTEGSRNIKLIFSEVYLKTKYLPEGLISSSFQEA